MKTKKRSLQRGAFARIGRAARSQRGTAMIIAIMVMALLAIFVAAAVSRVTNEARVMGADQANTEAYFAAQAALERMSRNFSNVYDVRIRPTPVDITNIQTDTPASYAHYQFDQVLTAENGGASTTTTVDNDSPFAGLVASRTSWRMDATAFNDLTNAEVRLTRTLNNYTIPIFQFGIFYDDPMEHHPGPPFAFGGRVHTNGDIYLMAGNTSTNFRDRVTAHGEVVVDVARNGDPYTNWGQRVRVNDGTGTYRVVSQGSVTGGPDIAHTNSDLPDGSVNTAWPSFSTQFNGNLIAHSPALRLPLQIGSTDSPIEIVRRGLPGDTDILRDSRYYNKPGLRITLSDTQAQLPGGAGGVQLNGTGFPVANRANAADATVPGYWPTARIGGAPRATKINGYRMTPIVGRQIWIKVEAVRTDSATLAPVATDITTDILSLGTTQPATFPRNGGGADITVGDADAVIKLQRFAMQGPPPKVAAAGYFQAAGANVAAYTVRADGTFTAGGSARAPNGAFFRNIYTYVAAGVPAGQLARAVVATENAWVNTKENNFLYPTAAPFVNFPVAAGVAAGVPLAPVAAATQVLPFPIKMFDTREGVYNDSLANTGAGNTWAGLYQPAPAASNNQRVPVNGVMGMIDFDVTNFKRLVDGAFNGTMPGGLTSAGIPDNDGIGWIVYFSDRRNDLDNDGQYDNENVYVAAPTDTTGFTPGEDVNRNGTMQTSYDTATPANGNAIPINGNGESATFSTAIEADIAAFTETSYNRHAQRLLNGTVLPGNEFKGFSFASENGVYIQGNYNATGVSVGMVGSNPSTFDQYRNTLGTMVPASVVSDAVSILSTEWNDGKSFRWAYEFGTTALDGRFVTQQTTVRTALLMGDALSFDRNNGPTQGGGNLHMSGGVHNFKRFREHWNDVSMNYCGSLINLFNSVNNTGPFKCCNHIYAPPTRNWVFDSNFLDPRRLPPGTPFFQYINLTGFRRTYRQDATD